MRVKLTKKIYIYLLFFFFENKKPSITKGIQNDVKRINTKELGDEIRKNTI